MDSNSKNKKVAVALNKALTMELTAVHQYLYHAALLRDWGFDKLAALEAKEAQEETDHANQFSDRILFLGSDPEFKSLKSIKKANSVKKIIENNLAMEIEAVKAYKNFIRICTDKQDFGTRAILINVLIDEEKHVEHLTKQQNLIKTLGMENFLLSCK